jgi:hypothetical protein
VAGQSILWKYGKVDFLVLTPANQNYVYKKRDKVVSVPALKA